MTPWTPGLPAVAPAQMRLNTLYHFARAGQVCTVIRRGNYEYHYGVLHDPQAQVGDAKTFKTWAALEGAVD